MNQYIPILYFLEIVHISLRDKYVYVATPKAACSTIKATLIRMELDDEALQFPDSETIHERRFSPHLNPRQVSDFQAIMHDPAFFKFCFVRNPYDRLLSCYLDKIKRYDPIKDTLTTQLGRDLLRNEEITFREFVDLIAAQPISLMNGHWRVQYYQTMQDTISYDFVGKVETLEQDLATISERIGRNVFDFYDGKRLKQTGAADKTEGYYDDDLRESVYQLYQRDFEHFGYQR